MLKQKFKLKTEFKPDGDQPNAIKDLVRGLKKGLRKQTLLGATGTGKTFTVANVIEKIQKPTLVIAHNKTLAAQLAQEYKQFFPDNAVHYFVSYYDYYQPEAYLPVSDTYIEKDAQINKEIDRLRHASTQALLSRSDVIIVASVSCIYGLGSPEEYREENFFIEKGMKLARPELLSRLIELHFERTNADLSPGQFRALGNKIEIMPVSETFVYSIEITLPRKSASSPRDSAVSKIQKIDPVSSKVLDEPKNFFLFPAKHFLTQKDKRNSAISAIKRELNTQLKKLESQGKILEAERLKRRTNYDIAMIREIGYCNGIENYSRHLSGRRKGEPPETLLSYFPRNEDGSADFLVVIDESHVTLPQVQGMYAGDRARKENLVEHGFRLPSALDNRPLMFDEFEERIGQVVYTSATPALLECEESGQIVEQIIRPTGLVDPELEVRPVTPQNNLRSSANNLRKSAAGGYRGQVQDFISEAKHEIEAGNRVLATTLTKKMAEDLASYLKDEDIKAEYLHSEIKTIDRIKILTNFRKGKSDILVGVNLLREGLDLPEVSFIGILDADKEGFLRSETSLIQTIGRAARNAAGRVILYADQITGSMERAIEETNRRRKIQLAYNKKHKITPKTIKKGIHDITEVLDSLHDKVVKENLGIDMKLFERNPKKFIKQKEREMAGAVKELDFESAAIIRDELTVLKQKLEDKEVE